MKEVMVNLDILNIVLNEKRPTETKIWVARKSTAKGTDKINDGMNN